MERQKGKVNMRKLTKASMAIALSLMMSLLLFTSGAFAQSASRSSASVIGQQTTPALASSQKGCGHSLCGAGNGFVRCRSIVRTIKVWRTRRIAETVRVLRVSRSVVFVQRGWQTLRQVRLIKVWQVKHIVKTIRILQAQQRSFHVCSAF